LSRRRKTEIGSLAFTGHAQELESKKQAAGSALLSRRNNEVMKTIAPFELQMLINKRGVEVIDVRSKDDFKRVHAVVARSIPLASFEPHTVLAHRKLDKREPLYIMCHKRMLASLAAGSLAAAGLLEPVVVDGGMEAWERQCLPLARERPRRDVGVAIMNTLLLWRHRLHTYLHSGIFEDVAAVMNTLLLWRDRLHMYLHRGIFEDVALCRRAVSSAK
jgi:rhodanese-related sulfurtransferase